MTSHVPPDGSVARTDSASMWWGDRIRRERLYAMSELQRPAKMSQRLVRIVKRISRILVAGAGDCVTGSEDHAYRELTDCFATLLGRRRADLPYHLLD
jgi:hypothetical protein